MENLNTEDNNKKVKIGDEEYLFDSLPDEAKRLITGLRTADIQTNMYEDTLRLISISKTKMIEDLKKAIENVETIKGQ
tara:strand:- start:75 stop:308 length:234 start_codon:yes stop_codon:yes gene_type:complete